MIRLVLHLEVTLTPERPAFLPVAPSPEEEAHIQKASERYGTQS